MFVIFNDCKYIQQSNNGGEYLWHIMEWCLDSGHREVTFDQNYVSHFSAGKWIHAYARIRLSSQGF